MQESGSFSSATTVTSGSTFEVSGSTPTVGITSVGSRPREASRSFACSGPLTGTTRRGGARHGGWTSTGRRAGPKRVTKALLQTVGWEPLQDDRTRPDLE